MTTSKNTLMITLVPTEDQNDPAAMLEFNNDLPSHTVIDYLAAAILGISKHHANEQDAPEEFIRALILKDVIDACAPEGVLDDD